MGHALDMETTARAMLAAGVTLQAKRTPRVLWSTDDVAFLSKHYRRKGAAWCAGKLGRTAPAVRQAARLNGIRQFWTSEELITLRAEWGALCERGMREKLPGRTWQAIASKAIELGLRAPNQGLISVREAVRRTGLERAQLRRVLAAAGVKVRLRIRTRESVAVPCYRQRVVDAEEVDAAVSAWLTAESKKLRRPEAAAAAGISSYQMTIGMHMLAATRPVEGLRGGRLPWGVSREDAMEAAAMYRARRGGR
jgi:hypothetical protein